LPSQGAPGTGACRLPALPRQPARGFRGYKPRGRVRSAPGRAPRALGMGVFVDAEGHRPLACQHVRLLCDHARLNIGHAEGFAWLRELSDETLSDRLRHGTPREPSPSLLNHIAQLGPGRRPAYCNRLQHLPKLSLHSRPLDTLAARPSRSRNDVRRVGAENSIRLQIGMPETRA